MIINMRMMVMAIGVGIIISTLGCNKDEIKVYPVQGKILYNGTPIDEVQIYFVPKDGTGRGATAISDAAGNFTVMTHGSKKNGAVAGEYYVLAAKTIGVDNEGKQIKLSSEPPDHTPSVMLKPQIQPIAKSLIPEKYNNPQKPLLEATIIKGKNILEFNLQE